MSTNNKKPWRFAPLNPAYGNPDKKPQLRGIVFDVDGTLCEPQNYMFREMRETLSIPKTTDILEHINTLPPTQKSEAQDAIRAIERRAMALQTPQPGLQDLMTYLDEKNIRKGICTRNFDEPIDHLLRTFLPRTTFSPIITRAFHPPKPDPAGILHICDAWGIDPHEKGEGVIMVGDSVDDMSAGSRAGAVTVLLVNEHNEDLKDGNMTDACLKRLDDLIVILERGNVST